MQISKNPLFSKFWSGSEIRVSLCEKEQFECQGVIDMCLYNLIEYNPFALQV